MYWRRFFVRNKTLVSGSVFVILCIAVILICLLSAFKNKTELEIIYPMDNVVSVDESKHTLLVHIDGDVINPGVFALKTDARMKDVLNLAKPRKTADLAKINLALPLYDGQKIYIKKNGETFPEEKYLLNINTASRDLLAALPGLGYKTAENLINYRSIYGDFTDISGILQVKSIGEARFNKAKDYISVGGAK